jgi:hypothetical protein
MAKTTRVIVLLVMCSFAGSAAARAQAAGEQSFSASVNAGGQFQNHTFIDNNSFVVFSELATVSDTQTVGQGFVFDASVAYRAWRHLSIGLGLSTFSGTSNTTISGSIPSPLVFGQPKVSSTSVSGLGQTDVAVNLTFGWTQPVTDAIDIAIVVGPSLINVKQDVASASVPAGTQDLTSTTTTQSKTTGKAGQAGIDLSYKINSRYGAGVFVRYLGGEVDLPAALKLKVGGVQVGGGLRIRF